MKTINNILSVLLLLAVGLAMGFACGYYHRDGKLPTIVEIQKKIGAVPDGKLGPSWKRSQTQCLWQKEWQRQNEGKFLY